MGKKVQPLVSNRFRGAIFVVLVWSSLVATLLVLQRLGHSFGFNVWWLGESRQWIWFLQQDSASAAARLFWQLDSRNPLSPWWYIAFKNFILGHESAFLVLHLATSLLLGLSSYLFVMAATNERAKPFAASLGALSAVFLVSIHIGNIHWNFIGALAFSMLSAWAFAEFLNSDRRKAGWIVWSIIFWIVAFQTYTIQSGAIIVVAFLSITDTHIQRNFLGRVATAIGDTIPYAASLIIFVLVWRTTGSGITETTTAVNPSLVFKSLKQALWHSDISVYLTWFRMLDIRVVLAVAAVTTASILFIQSPILDRTKGSDGPITLPDLTRVFLSVALLMIPTVVLESTSSMFPAGTRWTMVYQLWAPTLVLSATALAVALLPTSKTIRSWIWKLATAILSAGAIVLTLAYNHIQIQVSSGEKRFTSALGETINNDINGGKKFPRHYVIHLTTGLSVPSDYVSRVYVKTTVPAAGETTYKYIYAGPTPYKMSLLEDRVINPDPRAEGTAEYGSVDLMSWDGSKMGRLAGKDCSIFIGYNVTCDRKSPLP